MTKLINSLNALARQSKDDVKRTDKYSISVSLIKVREGFNARNLTDMSDAERAEYDAYIEGLAQAYLRGDSVPSIVIKMVDGIPVIVDGHCRFTGLNKAITVYGANIERITVEEFKGDDADEVAFIAVSNNNRKLRPLELAQVYVRLEKYGKSDSEIAEKMGKTVPHVIQVKAYYSMPVALKQMVNLDQIAVAVAMDLYNTHGTKAVEIAQNLVSKAKSEGKARVTSKMASPKMSAKERRTLNTVAAGLYDAIKDVTVDESAESILVSLTPELLAQLKEITAKAHEIENHTPELQSEATEQGDSANEEQFSVAV